MSSMNTNPAQSGSSSAKCAGEVTLEIKKVLSMSPATGIPKAWSTQVVTGQLEVLKKTASIVRFKVGDRHFCASAKDFRERKTGSIFVA